MNKATVSLSVFYVPSRFQQAQNHIPRSYIEGEMSPFISVYSSHIYKPTERYSKALPVCWPVTLARNKKFVFSVRHRTKNDNLHKRVRVVEWEFSIQNFVQIMLIYCTHTLCIKSHDFHSVFHAKFLQFITPKMISVTPQCG